MLLVLSIRMPSYFPQNLNEFAHYDLAERPCGRLQRCIATFLQEYMLRVSFLLTLYYLFWRPVLPAFSTPVPSCIGIKNLHKISYDETMVQDTTYNRAYEASDDTELLSISPSHLKWEALIQISQWMVTCSIVSKFRLIDVLTSSCPHSCYCRGRISTPLTVYLLPPRYTIWQLSSPSQLSQHFHTIPRMEPMWHFQAYSVI